MRWGWVDVEAMEDLEEKSFVVTGVMSLTGYSTGAAVCGASLETFQVLAPRQRSYFHHRPSSPDFRH